GVPSAARTKTTQPIGRCERPGRAGTLPIPLSAPSPSPARRRRRLVIAGGAAVLAGVVALVAVLVAGGGAPRQQGPPRAHSGAAARTPSGPPPRAKFALKLLPSVSGARHPGRPKHLSAHAQAKRARARAARIRPSA